MKRGATPRHLGQGFTLLEVAISLGIVVTACISVLMLIANAGKQQQIARDQILAASAAVTLSGMFAQPPEDWRVFNTQNASATSWVLGGEYASGSRDINGLPSWRIDNNSSPSPDGAKQLAPYQGSGAQPQGEADLANPFSYPRRLLELPEAGPFGRYDWERRLIAPYGPLRPLPPDIARRLDSPGDEIARILDQGGQVYYMGPIETADGETGAITREGVGDQAAWARILVAFVGAPQQNVLPHHPLQLAPTALYPFPPSLITPGKAWNPSADQDFNGDRIVNDKDLSLRITSVGLPPITTWAGPLPSEITKNGSATGAYGQFFANRERLFTASESLGRDWRMWQYFTTFTDFPTSSDAHNPLPVWNGPGGTWMDTWKIGAPYFRRLCTHHWQRIAQQMLSQSIFESTTTSNTTVNEWIEEYEPTQVTVTEYTLQINPDRSYTWLPKQVTYTVSKPTGRGRWVTSLKQLQSRSVTARRGVPTPPLGVPEDDRLHGSDVRYEDHWPMGWGRGSQIRVGLPGLERRVRYRTAAMLLWAAIHNVQAGRVNQVNSSFTNSASNFTYRYSDLPTAGGADPEVIDASAWGSLPNPLLADVPLPADLSSIHPAQVLALSYIAHAAAMVTGYKPPFIARRNAVDPAEAVDLQRLGGNDISILPYRALTRQEFWLYDAWQTTARMADPAWTEAQMNDSNDPRSRMLAKAITEDIDVPILGQPAGAPAEWPPAPGPPPPTPPTPPPTRAWLLMESGSLEDRETLEDLRPADMPREIIGFGIGAPASGAIRPQSPGGPATFAYAIATSAGNQMKTRLAVGPVLNPFPPPFADRGVFSWTGARLINPTYDTEVTISATPSGTPRKAVLQLWPNMPAREISDANLSDSAMADRAMRNALKWAIAYAGENPNCHLVPKPLNRPVMTDQPLFAYDLFADGNKPNRFASGAAAVCNPITWGERALFGPMMPGSEILSLRIPTSWGWNAGFDKSVIMCSTVNDYDLRVAMAKNHKPTWFGGNQVQTTGVPDGYPAGLGTIKQGGWEGFFRDASLVSAQVQEARRMAFAHGRMTADIWGSQVKEQGTLLHATPARAGSFNATQPFLAAERCRQMVIWSCDWLKYEDAESAPSAPVDLSHTSLVIRTTVNNNQNTGSYLSQRMTMRTVGIPEEQIAWTNPTRDGTPYRTPILVSDENFDIRNSVTSALYEYPLTNLCYTYKKQNPYARLGAWGADRNGNGIWDRGPVPRVQRMRANELHRFVVYDPILWSPVR